MKNFFIPIATCFFCKTCSLAKRSFQNVLSSWKGFLPKLFSFFQNVLLTFPSFGFFVPRFVTSSCHGGGVHFWTFVHLYAMSIAAISHIWVSHSWAHNSVGVRYIVNIKTTIPHSQRLSSVFSYASLCLHTCVEHDILVGWVGSLEPKWLTSIWWDSLVTSWSRHYHLCLIRIYLLTSRLWLVHLSTHLSRTHFQLWHAQGASTTMKF